MCGIIGVASDRAISERGWLATGRDAMTHRGPDHAGEWWSADGRVGLAHRRLSIIDLSTAGHQPMQDASRSLSIVFNGEIYNFVELRLELMAQGHQFQSNSDTEVLLAAYREWGIECPSRFNGAFAFAICDIQKGLVFMARDRAGEKPLFYSVVGRALRFSSELKGLMADPAMARRIDPVALDCYLAVGYVPGERCILDGVNKLAPAHAMTFSLADGTSHVWRYWQLPELGDGTTQRPVDEPALVERLESLLEDAVRKQLVADVPVGVLLSGGVDSSLVTAMAARATSRVKTFTVRFPGHRRFDESEHARLIASHFGTEHLELNANEASVDVLQLLARQFDEPLVDSSMIPTFLVSQMIRRHCTVALGGDGGDELFGGYSAYSRLLWTKNSARLIPAAIRRSISRAATTLLPIGVKGRVWLQGLGTDFRHTVPLAVAQFDRPTRRQLMAEHGPWELMSENIREARVPKSTDLLERATRMDFENYLPEDILVKVDRASMINSLEVRCPILDYRLIEFAFGEVPSQLKATPTSRKVLLRRLAARVLPPKFDLRRKQGFSIPLVDWLQGGPWKSLFHDVLLGSAGSMFDRTVVTNLLAGAERGRANGERLFALVMFELWRREYDASF